MKLISGYFGQMTLVCACLGIWSGVAASQEVLAGGTSSGGNSKVEAIKAQLIAANQRIAAQSVELARIKDYQTHLLTLAKEDLEAAAEARSGQSDCASLTEVSRLCGALTTSYLAQDPAAQRPLIEGDK